jgi:hypothetical protein
MGKNINICYTEKRAGVNTKRVSASFLPYYSAFQLQVYYWVGNDANLPKVVVKWLTLLLLIVEGP